MGMEMDQYSYMVRMVATCHYQQVEHLSHFLLYNHMSNPCLEADDTQHLGDHLQGPQPQHVPVVRLVSRLLLSPLQPHTKHLSKVRPITLGVYQQPLESNQASQSNLKQNYQLIFKPKKVYTSESR
jgi:hypothetical protein